MLSSDKEIFGQISREKKRQMYTLEMIPSENFVSKDVLKATGSVLTNKYSEGYPGKRYYGGNKFIDKIEQLAIDRAKALFNVPYVNVQPYSGSPANMAVYLSVCSPGDVIMGQALPDGGHLTHGSSASMTGKLFKSIQYHVKSDGYLDIEEVRRLAKENKPKLIWVGSTAYSREFPFKEFSDIAEETGAYLAADISHISGLVVAGVHQSPVKHVHIVTTTTHKTLRGPRGAMIMVTEKGLWKDPELGKKIDKTIFPGMQGGPHDNVVAAIAITLREASTDNFKIYAQNIVKNSKALAKALSSRGIKIVTGGTDNHLMLMDLTQFGTGMGALAQDALSEAGIIVNKNMVPGDQASAFYPSGIRLGTPALTSRGMGEPEMEEIAIMISDVVKVAARYKMPEDKEERTKYIKSFRSQIKKDATIKETKEKVINLCKRFPNIYPEV